MTTSHEGAIRASSGAGARGAAPAVPNLSTANAGQYTVVASNSVGVTSLVVHLEVHGAAATKPSRDSGG